MSDDVTITAFLGVFEEKLEKMKKRLKLELEKTSKDRNKVWLKESIKEAKKMRDLVKKMKKETKDSCPHCGKDL